MNCPCPIIVVNPKIKAGTFNPLHDKKYLTVPCGKCFACLSNLRSDWIFRLKQMFRATRESCYFVTFTYDEENLPVVDCNPIDGLGREGYVHYANGWFPVTLEKDVMKQVISSFTHSTRPIKRMKLKYFLVGEYGEDSYRPHYHMALFGWHGDNVMLHDELQKHWHRGGIHILYLSDALIGYITKYMLKQYDDSLYLYDCSQRPFRLMSNGLGMSFCNYSNARYYVSSGFSPMNDGDYKRRIPRYLQEKMLKKYHVRLAEELDNYRKLCDMEHTTATFDNPHDEYVLEQFKRMSSRVREYKAKKYADDLARSRPYYNDMDACIAAERRAKKAEQQKLINKKFK